MVDKKIVNWIKDGEKKGYSRKELRQTLVKSKYPKKDIDETSNSLAPKTKKNQTKATTQNLESNSQENKFLDNVKHLLTSPTSFFQNVKDEPLKYSIYLFFSVFIITVMLQFGYTTIMNLVSDGFRLSSAASSLGLFGIEFIWISQLFMLGASLVYITIMHIIIKVLKGQGGFYGTLKVFCYSMVPYFVLSLVPFIGIFSIIYSLILMTIGYSEIHNISKGKASIAVFLPLVLVVFTIAYIVFIEFTRYI